MICTLFSNELEIFFMHLISPPTNTKKSNKNLYSNIFVIIYFKCFLNSYSYVMKLNLS